jgi:hypothetical protein
MRRWKTFVIYHFYFELNEKNMIRPLYNLNYPRLNLFTTCPLEALSTIQIFTWPACLEATIPFN